MLFTAKVIFFVWILCSEICTKSALWILMAWYISTRTSVATVLNTTLVCPAVSGLIRLWISSWKYQLISFVTGTISYYQMGVNTLRPRQNRRHFPNNIFRCIFMNQNVWISIKISLKFVPKAPINNISALVQILAWQQPGDIPLSEPMMISLLTHICLAQPQWVSTKAP